MDRIQNGNPSGRYYATYNATLQKRPKQEHAAFEQHLRDVPNVDAAVAHPSQILDVSQDQRIGVRTWRPRKGNSRSPLEPTAQLPLQSFAEEQPLGSAADRGDEYGAPAKRQRTLNNPQAATLLLPAINKAQIRRERMNNPDAPNKDLDGFTRPTNATQNSTLVTVGGDSFPIYSKDASLIGVLESESALRKGKVGEVTLKLNVSPLLRFARWLAVNGKQGLSTRLGETSLKQDLNQYEGSGGPSLETPLRHLKTAEAGGVPIVGRSSRNPHSCDEPLIKLNNATQFAALVTVGGNKRALYSEDASLIGVLESALRKGKVAEGTFKVNVNPLLNFARWLVANGKHGFATRMDERSLNQDLKQYEGSGGPSLKVPMHHLKIAATGCRLPILGRLLRNPNSQDEALIKQYNATPSAKNVDQAKAMRYTSALKPFNDYLDKNGKLGISDRLNHKALDDDVKLYPDDYAMIQPALVHLRKSGVGKLGSGRHIAPVLRGDAQFVAAPPVRARSNTFGGLQSFVDLNAPTPSDLRDDAHSAPVRPRGQMLRESEWQPMMQATGSAVAGTGGPDDFRPVHRGRLSPMSEAAPSRPARAPQPASPVIPRLPDTYRGLPLVDVTTLTTSSSKTHIGALDTTASSNVPNGSVLDATEWLSDAHIQRDYQLLEEQLQTTDPTLAARTRLMDPSVSHLLRHMAPQDARDTLQSIYNQNDAPADFLFLPVNNGTPTTPGTHWSLLLVDRRKPETRLAYHYDSLQREGYNDVPAKQLAGLLNATLAPARMPRQSNDYDCGVFVLDGTWALVGRLLDGQRPDHEPLHLDNLVADRQALQDRLTRPLPHEELPRQLFYSNSCKEFDKIATPPSRKLRRIPNRLKSKPWLRLA
ncbi:Ulp1 family isopeptidase [Mesorhizobium kowhaii]|uniref:Ulp1 family isopeptidase n=1 Tax=Mesorhizobium kowhaii TaxID=1300272 RepID=UPI0035ECC29A